MVIAVFEYRLDDVGLGHRFFLSINAFAKVVYNFSNVVHVFFVFKFFYFLVGCLDFFSLIDRQENSKHIKQLFIFCMRPDPEPNDFSTINNSNRSIVDVNTYSIN